MGRVLGIDFGERRIGVAVSDPTRTIAQPLETLRRRPGKRPPWTALLALIQQHEVDAVVVGLPLTLEGGDSDWTREVRAFADGLARRTPASVSLADERMTSVLAERTVRALGLPRGERERKERIDAAAATIILQAFLNAQGRTWPPTDENHDADAGT